MAGKWDKFVQARPTKIPDAMDVADTQRFEDSLRNGDLEMWINNRYLVHLYRPALVRAAGMVADGWPDMVWLSIRRLDRAVLGRDWRDLQRIKDELVGYRHEAVELFPLRKRINDSANQYHLWVLAEPNMVFPFGYRTRSVGGAAEARATGGQQRAFAEEHEVIVSEVEEDGSSAPEKVG